jgi:hypothetical protein
VKCEGRRPKDATPGCERNDSLNRDLFHQPSGSVPDICSYRGAYLIHFRVLQLVPRKAMPDTFQVAR